MRTVGSFPHRVREIEHCWIPLPDGCRLAARLWLPEPAGTTPVPALLEYLPYGKRDGTRERDEGMHRYFAGHGYACVRVDLRGTGESDGWLTDEYLPQEQADGLQVLRWIASQPWCSGRVGMIGKSWGGFNALQLAAHAPSELGAVISVCASDDRYADDAHYMGGCLLNENLIWGSVLFSLSALPPDPALVGEGWRERWWERLEHARPPAIPWLRHARRDAYWRQGSVGEDPSRVRCPVYAVGGWADGYSNAVPRLLTGLGAAAWGLVGPWAHVYPHEGVPGPAIGFLQQALRWWDRWLRGVDNGVDREPRYRVWMQEGGAPDSFHVERAGRWVAEETWPSPRIEGRRLALGATGLVPQPGPGARLELAPHQTVGLAAGDWCGFGIEGDLPLDQREDDAHSLVFDSEPLPERLEILGAPEVQLELAVDQPVAFVAVRLNDVAPDGASVRVTYGLQNLTHRDGHEKPEPLVPGRRMEARVRLNDVAHVFDPGHRLRVAVSTCYWPLAWPSPRAVTLSLFTGASHLALPVRPPRAEDARLPAFATAEAAPASRFEPLGAEGVERTTGRDPRTGETVCTTRYDLDEAGEPVRFRVPDIDLETGHGVLERFRIRDDDPLSAVAEIVHRRVLARRGWRCRVETRTRFHASEDHFHLEAELSAWEGGERVFQRAFQERIPRDGV